MDSKQKIFNLNNFLVSDTGRLTSLSLKRDLSLGGNKQKKIYKPNLNVVRNKNKGKPVNNNKLQQHQSKRSPKNTPNKNSQNNRYIQSSSVFSEGSGELKRPAIHSDRYLSYSDRDPTIIAIPKAVKTNWEVNTQDEKSIVDELLAEDNNSSSDDDDGDYGPVILPLKDNREGFLKTYKIKKEDPNEKNISEEIRSPLHNATGNDMSNDYDITLSFCDNKLYNEEHPCISLFRMPDSLPGKGFAEDSDKIIDFDLNQMTEGKIGQVFVRKSGKLEMKIGNMKYSLDSIESNPFKEDLMHIPEELKSECYGPDVINLGNIDEKYVLLPSWKTLFELKRSKK